MEARVQAIVGGSRRCSSVPCMVRSGPRIPLPYSGFSAKSYFGILRVTLAPPNGRGHFVRRVRIGCSVQVSPDEVQSVLNYCPNIEDFEAHELYPWRPSLASRSGICHCRFDILRLPHDSSAINDTGSRAWENLTLNANPLPILVSLYSFFTAPSYMSCTLCTKLLMSRSDPLSHSLSYSRLPPSRSQSLSRVLCRVMLNGSQTQCGSKLWIYYEIPKW